MLVRPRRLRDSTLIRNLIHETHLALENLIQPYFLTGRENAREPIQGFTGVYRWGIDALKKQVEQDMALAQSRKFVPHTGHQRN